MSLMSLMSLMLAVFAVLPMVGDTLVERDQRYGPHPAHMLDVYYAEDVSDRPILVMIHGGGWHGGDKRTLERLVPFFISHGFVVVIPNYRLAPEFTFPSQVIDIACAVTWSQERAEDYNADGARFAFFGNSAGAHLGAMIAYDRTGRYFAACPLPGPAFDAIGFIGLAGEYDFDLMEGEGRAERGFLGERFDPDLWSVAEPINYITPAGPPALLIAGDADTVVNPQNSVDLSRGLYGYGVYAPLHIIEDYGHMDPLRELYSNAEIRVSLEWFMQGILQCE